MELHVHSCFLFARFSRRDGARCARRRLAAPYIVIHHIRACFGANGTAETASCGSARTCKVATPDDPSKRLRARTSKPRFSARKKQFVQKKRDDVRPPGRAAPFARPPRPNSATARNFRPRCSSLWTSKRLDRDIDQTFGLFSWGSRALGVGVPGLEGVGGLRNFGCSTASLNLGRLHQASDGRLVSRKNKIVQND